MAKLSEIWRLPIEQRVPAMIERWTELNEHAGNRTPAERDEMAEIADAILPTLIEKFQRGTDGADLDDADGKPILQQFDEAREGLERKGVRIRASDWLRDTGGEE